MEVSEAKRDEETTVGKEEEEEEDGISNEFAGHFTLKGFLKGRNTWFHPPRERARGTTRGANGSPRGHARRNPIVKAGESPRGIACVASIKDQACSYP